MENTLYDGDNLWVDKLTYRFENPKRYDVIVFPYRFDRKTYYVKRIIGLPGETVQIDEAGDIYINGDKIPDLYGREVMRSPGRAIEPVLLSEDEYFVLGDNRNNSSDSRAEDVGSIKRRDIIGRVLVRIWPLRNAGRIQ